MIDFFYIKNNEKFSNFFLIVKIKGKQYHMIMKLEKNKSNRKINNKNGIFIKGEKNLNQFI